MKKLLLVLSILIVASCSAKKQQELQREFNAVYPQPVKQVAVTPAPASAPEPEIASIPEGIPEPVIQPSVSGEGDEAIEPVVEKEPSAPPVQPDPVREVKIRKTADIIITASTITITQADQPSAMYKIIKLTLILLFCCLLIFIAAALI